MAIGPQNLLLTPRPPAQWIIMEGPQKGQPTPEFFRYMDSLLSLAGGSAPLTLTQLEALFLSMRRSMTDTGVRPGSYQNPTLTVNAEGRLTSAASGGVSGGIIPGWDSEPGEDGWMGPPGLPGSSGPQGLSGAIGWDGEDGEPGPPGAIGAQGPTGPQGPAGAGGQSLVGPPGVDGEPGDDGWPIPGAQGVAGAAGPTGPTGPTGAAGPAGVGTLGVPGWDGEDGDAWVIPSPSVFGFMGARVHLTSQQTITYNTVTALSWGATDYDTNGFWAAGNPTRLTVPNGVTRVRLHGSFGWVAGTFRRDIILYKNGVQSDFAGNFHSQFAGQQNGNVITNFPSIEGILSVASSVLSVVPGDYFEANAYQTGAAGVSQKVDNAAYTWFEIQALA